MGQQESEVFQEGFVQKFGKVKFISNSKNEDNKCIKVQNRIGNRLGEIRQWEKIVFQLSNNDSINPFLVLPQSFRYKDRTCQTYCGQSSIEIVYQNFYSTLSKQIKSRHSHKLSFDEIEINYFLYILVKVGAFFQQKSSYIGNIHPTNIIMNQNGFAKIFTTVSSPFEPENICLLEQSRFSDVYISPQQLQLLHPNKQKIDINLNKSDTFSIGLVMLSIILLKDCYFLYDHGVNPHIKEEQLNYLKSKLIQKQTQYHRVLCNMVYNMLITDATIRNTPKYFYDVLSKHEEDILTFKKIDFHQIQQEMYPTENKIQQSNQQYSTASSKRPYQMIQDEYLRRSVEVEEQRMGPRVSRKLLWNNFD